MKKIIFAAAAFILLSETKESFAQRTFWLPYSHRGSIQVYGALVLPPGAKSSGFDDFDLSTWGYYNLKILTPGGYESRWRVPMSTYAPTGPSLGAAFGVEWFMTGRISFLAEGLFYGKKNFQGFNITAGANYYLYSVRSFVVGVGARAGIAVGNEALIGGANLVTSPIRYNMPPYSIDNVPEGSIYVRNGSATYAGFTGGVLQAGFTGIYWLKPYLGIKTFLGFGTQWSGAFHYRTVGQEGDASLLFNGDDSFVVKTDLTNKLADLKPSVSMTGFYASVGLVLRLRLPKY